MSIERDDIKRTKAWMVNDKCVIAADTVEEAIAIYRAYYKDLRLFTDIIKIEQVTEPDAILLLNESTRID